MKSSDGRWDYYLIYILAFVVVGSVMGFLVMIGASSLEAWFQGVATVAAMLVGIATLGAQRKHELQAEKEKDQAQRRDARNAVIALKSHQAELFERVRDIPIPVIRGVYAGNITDIADAHLFNELNSSAEMLKELPLTAMHIEMIHYLIGLREHSVVGAAWGVMLQKDIRQLSHVKREAKALLLVLEQWDEEIELL